MPQKTHVNVTVQLSIDMDHLTNVLLINVDNVLWRPTTTSSTITDEDEKRHYLAERLSLAKNIAHTAFNTNLVKVSFLQAILTEIATKTEIPDEYNSSWSQKHSDTIAVCNYLQLMCDKLLNC